MAVPAFTVMDVESVLLAMLAKPAIVRLAVKPTDDKAPIGHHVVEAKALKEGLKAAQCTQQVSRFRAYFPRDRRE